MLLGSRYVKKSGMRRLNLNMNDWIKTWKSHFYSASEVLWSTCLAKLSDHASCYVVCVKIVNLYLKMFYSKLKSTTSCEIWAARCHGTFGTLRVKFMWLICGILRLARRSAIIFEKCQRRAEQRREDGRLICCARQLQLPCPLSPPALELQTNLREVWNFTILDLGEAKFEVLPSWRRTSLLDTMLNGR